MRGTHVHSLAFLLYLFPVVLLLCVNNPEKTSGPGDPGVKGKGKGRYGKEGIQKGEVGTARRNRDACS